MHSSSKSGNLSRSVSLALRASDLYSSAERLAEMPPFFLWYIPGACLTKIDKQAIVLWLGSVHSSTVLPHRASCILAISPDVQWHHHARRNDTIVRYHPSLGQSANSETLHELRPFQSKHHTLGTNNASDSREPKKELEDTWSFRRVLGRENGSGSKLHRLWRKGCFTLKRVRDASQSNQNYVMSEEAVYTALKRLDSTLVHWRFDSTGCAELFFLQAAIVSVVLTCKSCNDVYAFSSYSLCSRVESLWKSLHSLRQCQERQRCVPPRASWLSALHTSS